MLSQPCAEDIRDMMAYDAATALTAGPRLISAGRYAVIDAGGWPGLTGLARLFGEVPADQYDPGYASAGTADWYVPARNSYRYGEPPSSGELLISFGTR